MKKTDYKQLKVIYHQAGTDARERLESELQARRKSFSTLYWNYKVNDYPVFVNLTNGLIELTELVWRAELTVERQWSRLPVAAQFQYLHSLLISEIQSTNEIEGIHSTRKEVREAIEAAENHSSKNASRRPFQEMAKTYFSLFGADSEGDTFPSNLKELRELYDQLLEKEISDDDRLDGEYFRKGTVSISDGIKQVHRGVDGEESINAGLDVMLAAQEKSEHVLVNAIVGHFILEHIHPFYDGNGRFGRFLLALRLAEVLSVPTAVSLSSAILREKNRYYKAFKVAEDPLNRGELTFFVRDLVEILLGAMKELLLSLQEKTYQMKSLDRARRELPEIWAAEDASWDEKQIDVLFTLGQVRIFGPRSGVSMEELSSALGKTPVTLRPVTKKLRDEGLIIELKKRPLVFALSDKGMELLNISD